MYEIINVHVMYLINIYKLYKVKAREFSSHCYCLREGVGLKDRDVSIYEYHCSMVLII